MVDVKRIGRHVYARGHMGYDDKERALEYAESQKEVCPNLKFRVVEETCRIIKVF